MRPTSFKASSHSRKAAFRVHHHQPATRNGTWQPPDKDQETTDADGPAPRQKKR